LPQLKALTQTFWAVGAVVGSLLGGWLASRLGRRLSYFAISLGSLAGSAYIFLALRPTSPEFLWATFGLGLVSTSFFGWLPYFLPDLFPTRVRATGTGISYNFGRVFSAAAIMASTALTEIFQGDIASMGAATSLIYALGLLIVWWIPARAELHRG
jgi:MFS transporter, SHS family, sialic acid transporter